MRAKAVSSISVGLLISALFVTGTLARELTIVGWGGETQDAQRELYFKPFATSVGKPFLEDTWNGGYGVLQAKVKAASPNWDVVQVEADELALGCADGIFEKIDWSKIGSKEQFMPQGASECGVGVNVWSLALAYNADRLKGTPKSWADFWDVKAFPGKRALRKGPKSNLEFALLADGVAPAELYKVLATRAGVDRAFQKLDELRSSLVWWESGGQPLQYLASGEVAMSSTYNARVTAINKLEGRNLKLVWPQSLYSVDSWVILRGAENKALAQDFIAFASRPESQAQLPLRVSYGVPNRKAGELIPPAIQENLPTYPANLERAIAIDTGFWIDNLEALTERFNAWLAK